MKVFHSDKYQFVDIMKHGRSLYYAFECIKEDFVSELVLVRQARVDFPDHSKLYFDEALLVEVHDQKSLNRLRVNRLKAYAKLADLAENESKRCDRRAHSEVETLTH